MRRISVIVAMAVALIASSFMLTSADAHNRDRYRHDRADGYQFLSVTDQSADIDVGDPGPSLGDYFVFHDNVYKLRYGHHRRHHREAVGELNGQCTTTQLTGEEDGSGQCLVTASMPDGDLTVQGAFHFQSETATFAVTGGTGSYSGASGEVHAKFLSETKTLLRFDLN